MSVDPARRVPVLRVIVAFVGTMVLAVAAKASPITYQVNRVIGAGSVTGFIQTDGTIGVLSAANFIDWDLMLKDSASQFKLTGPLSGGNSSIFVRGTDAAAFDSFLLFNFSGIDYGVLVFEKGLFSALHYYCDSTQPNECAPGETVAPDSTSGGFQNAERHGVVVLGITADPIPEPATYALVSLGLALSWLKTKVLTIRESPDK